MAPVQQHGLRAEGRALAPREDRLLRVWELRAARDFAGLEAILAPLPDAELAAEPELGVALGEALLQSGGWDRALALAERLAAPCRLAGGGRLERRRLSVAGQILYARGRVAEATGVWGALLDSAAADGEEQGIGIAMLNLGSIAAVRAEWEEAMSLFARAVAVAQTLGDEPLLGVAHGNLAMAYLELGLVADADHHLRNARRLLRAAGTPYQAARTELSVAFLHLRTGELALARWTADRARTRLAAAGFPQAEADAMRVLAMTSAAEGRLAEAASWLRGARERLEVGGDLVTEAEVYEEWALVARRSGDAAAAAEHEAAAARLYAVLQAPRRAARMSRRLAAARVDIPPSTP